MEELENLNFFVRQDKSKAERTLPRQAGGGKINFDNLSNRLLRWSFDWMTRWTMYIEQVGENIEKLSGYRFARLVMLMEELTKNVK